jgi:hypothetical protein
MATVGNLILKNRLLFLFSSIFVSILIGILVFYYATKSGYESYWTAIDRVRTVDFNIISSSFPVAAREAIKSGNNEVLNDMVASNSSNFGLSIQVCKTKTCDEYEVLANNNAVEKPFFERIEIPIFEDPTLGKVMYYEHSYSKDVTVTDYSGFEKLGVIVFYRPFPPDYKDDIAGFLGKFFEGRDFASRYINYRFAFYLALLASLFLL